MMTSSYSSQRTTRSSAKHSSLINTYETLLTAMNFIIL